jgi:glycosyltransferase involved in cell wall biosynthesis
MRLLLCHSYYKQRGGEDLSFESEARLLERKGHDVVRYTLNNDSIDGLSGLEAARKGFWNRKTFDDVKDLLQSQPFDVLHCTNTFPLISPAAYDAARAAKVPIVQSLRNYRLLCPTSFFMRDGRVCEDCITTKTAWPGVLHACYKESRKATAAVAVISMYHRYRRATSQDPDCYYTLTEFARQKFVEGGFPEDRLLVKSNFVDPDPGVGSGAGGYAVFAGRLSAEKGLNVLLDAWAKLAATGSDLSLKIVGDGPLAPMVREAISVNPRIQWLGELPLLDTLEVIREATALVMPSVWYETFGRTMIESFACGTPVIASRLGSMAEVVEDGFTGSHFNPGDADDLVEKINLLTSNAERLRAMRIRVREEYEQKYTAEANYSLLMAIYEKALQFQSAR